MPSEYRLNLPKITLDNADKQAKPILEKARAQVGFIPNMYVFMANSPALLDTYLHGYDLFRKQSGLSPAEQEVVLLTISRDHGCDYCVAAHSMLADKRSGVSADVIDAIRNNTTIQDQKLSALSRFTSVMLNTRGLPSRNQVEAFLSAGYNEQHILDIILALAVKTISNFSNHLFHTPVDDMFADYARIGWEDSVV